MKILFFCTGLQPGRDGVGDYTRLLAGELAQLGHDCAIVALNDSRVATPSDFALMTGPKKIPCLRLPAASPWPERAGQAGDFRTRFGPDWISFQIVPNGLDPRGIVHKLTPTLLALTSGRPLHLMFHELWTGAAGLAHLRRQVLGALQRRSLRRMISVLQPRLVTTSNPVYAAMLKTIGTTATLLPLFGNIPVMPLPPPLELPPQLREAGLSGDGSDRGNWWVAIFFGAIHSEWKPEPFLGILRRAARRNRKRVALLQAGYAGTVGEATWENLQRHYRSDFALIRLGEQPPDTLSRLLQIADFGIAASPWHLIGKSGTVAAMLDHGLPVIVTRNDFIPRLHLGNCPAPDRLLHRCDDALEGKLLSGLAKQPPHARAGQIAAQLGQQLHSLSRTDP